MYLYLRMNKLSAPQCNVLLDCRVVLVFFLGFFVTISGCFTLRNKRRGRGPFTSFHYIYGQYRLKCMPPEQRLTTSTTRSTGSIESVTLELPPISLGEDTC